MRRVEKSERGMAPVILANIRMDRAKDAIRGVESTLARTKERIEQSKQRIVVTDKLITELSCLLSKPRTNQKKTDRKQLGALKKRSGGNERE